VARSDAEGSVKERGEAEGAQAGGNSRQEGRVEGLGDG